MLTLRQKSAIMIRSLMRNLQVSGHVVFPADEKAISAQQLIEELESVHVGDGSGDAACAIGEHAFKAGYEAAAGNEYSDANAEAAWSAYDPPEDIKGLS